MGSQAITVYNPANQTNNAIVPATNNLPPCAADPAVQNLAMQMLSYGECLSYAKYAKYIPGAPTFLTNKSISLIGDTCKVINSGLQIKGKVAKAFSTQTPLETKIKELSESGQLALQIANTQFADYLPEAVSSKLKWMNDACGLARLGCLFKEQVDKVSSIEEPSLAKTKEKLEAARLAVWAAGSTVDLVGSPNLSTFRTSLSVGYGLVTAAKAGVTAANFLRNLA